ncbi:PREDICTED: histone-lysine N-methyltransferase trithorax [Polistes canadensis]|uniref:histone-lysine N-methyltransferase trithorax n=1 Tax=Polistes canadensis TaxID=91411 RepID=UPI000718B8E1|nr:PREDICTED: histone-lysine N-methyltransferase trithorax [Polistes canadensis]
MGRSKFPGKPPKTVTRKRIKVLGQPETVQNDSVTVAENIYYGLSLFNETFGDNEKEHPPFHGFSTKEANLSVSYIKTQQHGTETTNNKNPSVKVKNHVLQSSSNKDITNVKNSSSTDMENNIEKLCDTNTESNENVKKDLTISDCKKTTKIHKPKTRRNCNNIKFSNFIKTPVLKSVNAILDQHQRTRQLRNSTAKRLLQRAKSNSSNVRNTIVQSGDKSNTVRKFILPIRSAHSSRVIKPNKRFIEELEDISGTEHNENDINVHVKKARFAVNKLNNQESKSKEESGVDLLNTKLKVDEIKSKSKKIVQRTISDSQITSQTTKTSTKSSDTRQDVQVSKPIVKEVKKNNNTSAKVKLTNSLSNESDAKQDSSENTSGTVQSPKSTISRNNKQTSVPTKVLPDINVPNYESSRVQTRSGTQCEVFNDTNIQNNIQDNTKLTENNSTEKQCCLNKDDKTVESNSDNFDTESTLSESGSDHSNHTEDEQSEWSGIKLNGGKVILRKARLKLDNKCVGGTEGPFSVTSTNNNSNGSTNLGLTGTIKCGVCGAVRFYRFVKQARKFGIHSCESCRKFISKMIKRQGCAKSTNSPLPFLQCHKGDGLCLVPPVVRSHQWNLMRCVYKARCPACWLKMCLKCYNIPATLRSGLNSMLPPIMRDPLSTSALLGQDESDCQGQKSSPCKISWPAEDSLEKNLFKSAMSWKNIELGQKTAYQGTGGFLYTKLEKFDAVMSTSPSKKRRKHNRIKVRKKIKNPILPSPQINHRPQPLRQKLELKGPRVKHVCRSASVALGQPIATFPSLDSKEESENNSPSLKTATKQTNVIDKKNDNTKEKEVCKDNDENNQNTNIITVQQSYSKKGKSQQNISISNLSMISKTNLETSHTVSIDFWEQYDPAEVGAKGFALIGSELFYVPAICFLCGSAGKEPLIYCQCCCEPYHAFCLEPSDWSICSQPNWCCPRCTICQSCHLRFGPKLSCIRCRQSFHHTCLLKSGISSRLYSPDRPYVCQSCIKCKSCGSEGVNVHVGNLPLCSMCFKLRQQGNYCPLCQKCYNENDFDTKMMECSECSCWVHARCEGLSDEKYQILSYLPDSIEFTCQQCSDNPNSVWKNAVEAELKAGFIGVIKSLSKNRKACAALKWSPKKECFCKSISTIKKIDLPEEKAAEINGTNNKEITTSDESDDVTGSAEHSSVSSLKSDLSNKSELEEQPMEGSTRKGLRRLRQKFHLKECTVRVKNCIPKDTPEIDKKDPIRNQESTNEKLSEVTDCHCMEQQIIVRPSPTLMTVKQKVNNNEYKSLAQFHADMEHVINRTDIKDLIDAYHETLQEVFPWFVPKNSKADHKIGGVPTPIIDTDENNDSLIPKPDDSMVNTNKEEIVKGSKAVVAKPLNSYNTHQEDSRSCCLCKGLGDGQETKEGRLLYCGQNEWVHANCALWSNEVFEEIDGSLQNVHSAISRGRLLRCSECGKKGASIGCCAKNCNNTFHYPCARNIGLAFNDDKTVFCFLHLNNSTHKPLHNEADFSLKRPVYVELDRKKKKYVEPNKVKVMIGSLIIDCLGTIVPEFSDTVEKIIPCDYKCSRLYWSTVNPFKIVRYYIRTYVQVFVPEVSADLENNITIDHSKEQRKEDLSIDKHKVEYLAVKQTLDALLDTVCSKEVDENLAEQNNTDLLPPELEEAIFEDLPHDLLDGISMQDIFPKMTIEDFLTMDLKNDGTFTNDLFKDDMLPSEVAESSKPVENKISKMDPSLLELGTHNDLWVHLEAKTSVQDFMDDLFNSKSQKRGGRELKRSKSEVISNNSLIVGGPRHHQRSCSLTWSCKLDNTYGPSIKRRKLPRNAAGKSTETSVMVLDAQNEHTSMIHELRIPESIMVTVGRANTPNIISDSVREIKYCIEDSSGINRHVLPSREDGKEHKRLFWHTRQQPRILQVDGSADPSSASECSSPEYNIEDKTSLERSEHLSIPQLDGINDESSCDDSEWILSKEKDLNLFIHPTNVQNSRRIFGLLRSHLSHNDIRKENDKDHFSHISKSMQHKTNFFKGKDLKLNLQIPQLDGADDVSSDDECISPKHNENEITNVIPHYNPPIDHTEKPVTCERCRCTYRTQDSYNRHLINCDIMITSDSDSEIMDNKLASPDSRFSPNIGSVSPQFITLSPSEGHTLSSEYTEIQATSPIEASVPSPHPGIQIEPIAQAIITPQLHTRATVETVHQTVLTSNDMIVQTQYTRTTATLPNATVLPQESTVQITEITDPPTISNDSCITQTLVNMPISSPDSASSQSVPSPQISPTFSSTGVQTATNDGSLTNIQISRVTKSKSPRAARPRAKNIKSHVIKNSVQSHNGPTRLQPMQASTPVIQLQQAQRPNGPTVILQQVPSPSIMSAYVETLQQQTGQNLQYITAISGQHETGYKPQFITTNQLVPGTYIQTPSDNLLALQNGGISILPSVQIAQTQPTVLGTIIQQQPSAIQCGVISSEQLLLSSTPTLEMFTDSTGSMFVSNQPMYYGLETIVSNTVMSSSQFMTGAVPQVLASSYQTTTQVFQASKLMEPIVDVQSVSGVPTVTAVEAVPNIPGVPNVTGLPTVPSVPTVPAVPSIPSIPSVSSVPSIPSVPSVPSVLSAPTAPSVATVPNMPSLPNASNVQAMGNVPSVSAVTGVPGGYVVVSQHTPVLDTVVTPQINIPASIEQNFASIACNSISPSPCRTVVEALADPVQISDVCSSETPITITPRITSPPKPLQQTMPTIPRVAVRPSPASHPGIQLNCGSWKITEQKETTSFDTEQIISNSVRPYFDSKHVSENTSMIKASISSKILPLPNHCITQRNIIVNKLNHDVNNVHNSYSSNVSNSNGINVSTSSNPVVTSCNLQNKITMSMSNVPTSRPMNRVLPMQAVTPKQDLIKPVEKDEIVMEEPTKPIIKPPIELTNAESKKQIIESIVPIKKSENEVNSITETQKLSTETVEKVKDNLKLELDKEKLHSTSLKIVLQKQLQDGSYKIRHNMKAITQNKKSPQVTSVEILPTKQVPQITSLQLLPIKTFTLKTNKIDEKVKSIDNKVNVLKKSPPVAVKKPRIITKSMKLPQKETPNPQTQKSCSKGPNLMYEIKSQDGFTHTASSMSEVWDMVFQAVQNARKAHNLPPLPHNPLSENLGLENNATVYLVEQLPGVNRCTKYKPKFHNLTPAISSETDNDLLAACDNGAARAEPFKGRKVHDMFSWLASRHRQQPKMIAISEAESRRVTSTNLPMAMRFRILKETSKESVGVYHSHIHGRGLFCLRDIEAGEMVIEYAGEVIRASLTDKREKYYDSKNIGCYMFKIDDHLVVDATMKGNAARFINHSCEPNCYSRVVDILGKKHILIFALRRIVQGEELTYDYKFPFEDIKIPCTCGSRRCRKYLN